MDIFHFNISITFLPFSFHFFEHIIFLFLFFLSFSSSIFNFLLLITSSSDVRFLIRQILWLTHNLYFRETVPDNWIHFFVLHIFLRTILGSMKGNLYFLYLDYPSTGALKLEMRSIFLISLLYSVIFSISLRINLLACN